MKNKEILSRVYQLIKPHRGRLGLAVLSMVAVSVLSSAQAYMVKPLLDEIFFKKNQAMLNLLPLALVMIFLVKGVFYYCYSYLMEQTGHRIVMEVRTRVYAHIQSLPLSFFNKTPTGELISRIAGDVGLMQAGVSSVLIGIMKDFFTVAGLLGVILYQDWKLALMSLIILPLAALPIYKFGKKFREISFKTQQIGAVVISFLQETLTGTRIVKAFCREEYEVGRFAATVKRLYDSWLRDAQVKSLSHPIMEIIGGICMGGIIWYGGRQVLQGSSTPGTFFSFLTALIMIYEPIKGLSRVNNPVQHGMAASQRVFTLLDTKSDIIDTPQAGELPPFRKEIRLEDVRFHYAAEKDVIKGIDLTVKAGEVVALVGTSGGGKTTLTDLIPRFYDVTGGAIRIDGQDIRDVTLRSLREQIAVVTQHTILFNDTVRNNIAYGDPTRTDAEIRAAAKAANALGFIEQLPDGFDTIIGESGSRLSGGQRQRISIARALCKNAPILILDEATSALDTESEREVQKALENLMRGRTTLVIAHRLSTIRNADRIIVIQNGVIVEQGKHEELLVAEGAYKKLHLMQHEQPD
ncbi:lipid A export permease/ATP-binding protein MsbA [Thiovibrio sp. JS02]